MIRFPCPTCGATLKVPEEKAGVTSKCPKCGAQVTSPRLTGQEPIAWVQAAPPLPVAQMLPAASYAPPAMASQSGFRCPYCQSTALPRNESKVSQAGWVMFWLTLLFLCFPICWIGLLMKDHYKVCSSCGIKLG